MWISGSPISSTSARSSSVSSPWVRRCNSCRLSGQIPHQPVHLLKSGPRRAPCAATCRVLQVFADAVQPGQVPVQLLASLAPVPVLRDHRLRDHHLPPKSSKLSSFAVSTLTEPPTISPATVSNFAEGGGRPGARAVSGRGRFSQATKARMRASKSNVGIRIGAGGPGPPTRPDFHDILFECVRPRQNQVNDGSVMTSFC